MLNYVCYGRSRYARERADASSRQAGEAVLLSSTKCPALHHDVYTHQPNQISADRFVM